MDDNNTVLLLNASETPLLQMSLEKISLDISLDTAAADESVDSQECAGPKADLFATLKLTNISEGNIAFKLKTTSPDRYTVYPNISLLLSGQNCTVLLKRKRGLRDAAQRGKDKWMLEAVQVPKDLDYTFQRDPEALRNALLPYFRESGKPEFPIQQLILPPSFLG